MNLEIQCKELVDKAKELFKYGYTEDLINLDENISLQLEYLNKAKNKVAAMRQVAEERGLF